MNPLQTALGIIALLEQVEPGIQSAAMAIVSLWKSQGPSALVILEGEVTSLDTIIAKARTEQGATPVTPITDPDPAPPTV